MKLRFFFAIAALASADAAISAPPLVGIYSDIRRTDEGHWGAEVVISSAAANQYWAVVRCADYRVGKPVRLRATVNGAQVEIAADPSGHSLCPEGRFVGVSSGSGITGQFRDASQLPSSWPVHNLRRTRTSWQ